MIRLSTRTQDGTRLVMLVLEPTNLTRLRQDNPIRVNLADLVPTLNEPLELVIAYDADPEQLVSRLRAEYQIERFDNRRGNEDEPPTDFTQPHCPQCDKTFQTLGMYTAEDKRTAFFFCPSCGCTIGAQYLGPLPLR